jgi:uncharacterized protein YuzE
MTANVADRILATLTDSPNETTIIAALADHDVDDVADALENLDLSGVNVARLIDAVDVDFDVDWEEDGGNIYTTVDVIVQVHGKTIGVIEIPIEVEWYAYEGRPIIAYEGLSGAEGVTGLLAQLGSDRDIARAAYSAIDFGALPDEDEDEDGDYLVVEIDDDGEATGEVISRHASAVGAAIGAMGVAAEVHHVKVADVSVERDENGNLTATETVRTFSHLVLTLRSVIVEDAASCPSWAKLEVTSFLEREAA